MAKVTKVGNAFFQMPPSISQAWLTVYFYRARNEVGVFLTFVRGGFGDVAYPRLLEEKEEIECQLAVEVDWESDGVKHSITSRKVFPDIRAPECRSEIKEFLGDRINRFVNVFRPRLQRIAEEA